MAYDRSRGAHQAGVLYRLLHQDGRFPLAEVAKRAGVAPCVLNDWAANRQPIPQWATPRLVGALEQLQAGAGVTYMVEALELGEVMVVAPLPRQWGDCPTASARRVGAAAERFISQVLEALVDGLSPGRLDEHEVSGLEPARRELAAAVAAYGAAAARAARAQGTLGLAEGRPA